MKPRKPRGVPAGRHVGTVYLITDGTFCKIGFAKDLAARLQTLQNATPYELRVVDAIQTDDVRGLEAFLHGLFAAKHHRNEWFTNITLTEWRAKAAHAQQLLVESYQDYLPLRLVANARQLN
jgi:hypothetical protein